MTKPKTKLTPKRKSGRPTKFKEELLKDAQMLSELGFTEKELCAYWSVTQRTLLRWKNRTPELCLHIAQGQLKATIKITRILYNLAVNGNIRAIIFWLTNRAPKLWKDRSSLINVQQDIISQGNAAIRNQLSDGEIRQIINQYTPEQKRRMIETFRKLEKEFESDGNFDRR